MHGRCMGGGGDPRPPPAHLQRGLLVARGYARVAARAEQQLDAILLVHERRAPQRRAPLVVLAVDVRPVLEQQRAHLLRVRVRVRVRVRLALTIPLALTRALTLALTLALALTPTQTQTQTQTRTQTRTRRRCWGRCWALCMS